MKEQQKRHREIENMNLETPRKKQNNSESDGPIQITSRGFSASPLLESSNNKDNNPAICNPNEQDFDQILEDFLGNDPLKEEIWTINQLNRTYVEICDENDNSTTVAASYMKDSRAKIVKCTYRDLATVIHSLSSENASENLWPIQPLKLLIPGTYPDQSPLVLDKLSTLARDGDGASSMNNEEDLTGKAISILKLQLESFEQPLSLEKIAKAWDDVVSDVVHEYSNQLYRARYGRYGVWRGMCARAS